MGRKVEVSHDSPLPLPPPPDAWCTQISRSKGYKQKEAVGGGNLIRDIKREEQRRRLAKKGRVWGVKW